MIAPWMLKNWIEVRNPIAPFGNTVFRNPYFHPMEEAQYQLAMRWYDVQDKRTLPLEVILRGGKTQGLLGPLFLLSPIALLALRFRAGRRLLRRRCYWGSRIIAEFRHALSDSGAAFYLAGDGPGGGELAGASGVVMVVHAFLSWPTEILRYSDPYVWRLEQLPILEALRMVPQDRFLREHSNAYGAARMVEAKVPEGERILGTAGVAYAYCRRDFLIDYQAAFNQTLIDTFNVAMDLGLQAGLAGLIPISGADGAANPGGADRREYQSVDPVERP